MHVLQLADLRLGTYRLLAALFLYPTEPAITAASELARDLRRQDWRVTELAFYGPWDRFLRHVECLTPARVKGLQEEYVALFGGGAPLQRIPLYECGYLDEAATASGLVIGDLEKEYASAGLVASTGQAETPDHVAVELEFVSFLCEQEAAAWDAEEPSEALEAIVFQKRFLSQHPCQWLPILARAVEARGYSEFYTITTRTAHALTSVDVDFVEAWSQHLADHMSGEE